MINYRSTLSIQGVLAVGLLIQSPSFAQELVKDDLITSSKQSTPWQVCDTDALAIDVTTLNAGGCAYRTTPVDSGITYSMSCGVKVVKYASITLAFLDADDKTLATKTTEVTEHVSGAYSVTLESPPSTVTAAIGIYGEPGSGFQDCVLVDATPAPAPTKGSITGITWFDETPNSILDSHESQIAGSSVTLYVNGAILQQTHTDAQGNYYIGHLDVDACYNIVFGPADSTLKLGPPDGDNDAIAEGRTEDICLTSAEPDARGIDAAFVAVQPMLPPADYAICGVTWLDSNENGVFDGTDSTMANVHLELFDSSKGLIGEGTTDAHGNYVFNMLTEGEYQLRFSTPDGHETTATASMPQSGSSYAMSDGQTALFSLPTDGNTDANSACTIQHVNAGYIKLPVALDPTIANNDSITFDVGFDFEIDFLANDLPCDGAVHHVDLLGHNIPGKVGYDPQLQRFVVSDTTASGHYSIEYGLRGSCGSYDTATILVELLEVIPPAPPTAPDAPICRVETGGSKTIGGVDVFNPDKDGFATNYNFYDRDGKLVITVDSTDYTHKYLIGNNANQWEGPFIGNWEIEWNGTHYGYNQVSIYYVAAVENNEVSELTECMRSLVSPIAIDLGNKGRIQRLSGDYAVDLDGDGVKEALSQWFAPSAGILVTGNVSGQVTGEHLFGNVPGVHADGFAELATLDADKDGQLSGAELSGLAIWTDLNSNTMVDEGELSGLDDHNIVSLAVTHYKYMARATKADGRTLLMEDVWLPMAHMAALLK